MDKGKPLTKIGTLIKGSEKTPGYIERFVPTGIETVQIFFREQVPPEIDHKWMDHVLHICQENNIEINVIGFYANPLAPEENGKKAAQDWHRVIDLALYADIKTISGFTGRIPGTPLKESLPPVKSFFTPIIERLESYDKQLAFENCPMNGNWYSGSWNIAFCPDAWDLLFNKYLKASILGIEFDPSHSIKYGQPVDELIRLWGNQIMHVHGKDAQKKSIEESVNGWLGPEPPFFECFPGEGKLDWYELCRELMECGYQGSIDLEGYHSPFISHEKEVSRQTQSIDYLKQVRNTFSQT